MPVIWAAYTIGKLVECEGQGKNYFSGLDWEKYRNSVALHLSALSV